MPSYRCLRLSFVCGVLATLACCGHAEAVPVLLTSYSYGSSGPLGINPPATIPFFFNAWVQNPGGSVGYADWPGEYTPSDAGMIFTAPSDVVAGVRQAALSATAFYSLRTGFATGSPSQHLSFPGHTITSIERKIDKLIISNFLGNYGYEAAQTISFFGEPIPPVAGDFNRNGTADAADYVLWRNLNNQPVMLPNESGLNPGSVDIEDYWFWKANFGGSVFTVAAGSGTQSVPEPATAVLLVFALTRYYRIRVSIPGGRHQPKSRFSYRPIQVAA